MKAAVQQIENIFMNENEVLTEVRFFQQWQKLSSRKCIHTSLFNMSIKKEISLATDIIFYTGNDQSCIILKAYAYFAVKFTSG